MRRMFLMFVFGALFLQGYTYALVVKPSNVQMPTVLGDIFSFDLVLNSASNPIQGVQSTIAVQGPGALVLDGSQSKVMADDPNYWLFGNSTGIEIIDNKDGSYTFGDAPKNAVAQNLKQSAILARYAFRFDGPIGWHTFTINFDIQKSFSMNEEFGVDPIGWDKGNYPGTSASFDVYIVPEPMTLGLLGLGSFLLRRK